jgi:hypothetical protein
MFDAVGAFEKQFTPFEEGYLVYPSRRSGGKFITADEYKRLVADWKRVAGKAGTWKTVGAVCAVVLLWAVLHEAFSPPEWTNSVFLGLVVAAMSVWLFWASWAPRRLVKDRLPVVPPRSLLEAQRHARAALDWPVVIFGLIASGGVLTGSVLTTERSLTSWAWLGGSGLLFVLYLWTALKKAIDTRS